jgi:hypothetical protein
MRIGTPSTLVLLGLGTAAMTVLVFACGFDPPEKNPNPPTGGIGGGCKVQPGELPPADCDSSDNECTGGICTSGTKCCRIEPKCGDPNTCLPIGDNTGKSVLDLRIRRLNVATPPNLAEPFIQNVVVTKNIDLLANGKGGTPACGEDGQGSFNWLLRIDKAAGTMITGGAPPSDDFTKGYCFFNQTVGTLAVAPATVKVTFHGDTFDSEAIPKLNVPIFVGGNVKNAVILPITDAVLKNVTLSNDDNCIGNFNGAALANDCSEDSTACQKWKTAGAIGGYITLEEADQVDVRDLASSLCVVLTKERDPNNKCPRDGAGKITPTGDFCSTSKKAGDCQDSFWLGVTFAASAAKITDGAGVPECQSTPIVDAGADANDGGVDAAPDAPADAPSDAPADG